MIWGSKILLLSGCLSLSFYASVSLASDGAPAADALFIAHHLDVLSFPSSIYPRRRPQANTLMDYGFTEFKAKPNGVESIEDDGEWYFAVELIGDQGDVKELCITDQAANGGTYDARYPVKVRLGADGLFHAIEKPHEGKSC